MDKLSDEKRVDQAYLIALGHPPDNQIVKLTVEYLNSLIAQGTDAASIEHGLRCAWRCMRAMSFIMWNSGK